MALQATGAVITVTHGQVELEWIYEPCEIDVPHGSTAMSHPKLITKQNIFTHSILESLQPPEESICVTVTMCASVWRGVCVRFEEVWKGACRLRGKIRICFQSWKIYSQKSLPFLPHKLHDFLISTSAYISYEIWPLLVFLALLRVYRSGHVESYD